MRRLGSCVRFAMCSALFLSLLVPPVSGAEDDLDSQLAQVGEAYAEAYLSPLVTGFGVGQNSGLFTTASIPATKITVQFGLRMMASQISEDDQFFRKVIPVTLDETWGVDSGSPAYGQEGVVVFEGPTVFGGEDAVGSATAYFKGLPVDVTEGLDGMTDTRWVPLGTPELSVGGVAGLRATIRWIPTLDLGDLGEFSLFGYGLQYDVGQYFANLPVDVMVGFFRQDMDLGDSLETEAFSMFAAACKEFGLATAYFGLARESSSVTVTYTADSGEKVDFEADGEQEFRMTLGGTLNLGARLNVEMGLGDMTSYSAGLLFGF